MRNVLSFIVAGVVLLFGCSFAQSSAPERAGITQVEQHHAKFDPAHLPTHLRILFSFQDGADGANPSGDLLRDEAGNLYGGAFGSQYRNGAVFKLDPTGNETVLHAFDNGYGFYGDLLEDPAGNLYGSTPDDGHGGGVVFKLDPNSNYTVLHAFQGGSDGSSPDSGMVLDKAGNLYGVTEFGGSSKGGVVFKVDPTGKESNVLSSGFLNESHGGLIADAAGNLYGTTRLGGSNGSGTVYKVRCAVSSTSKCGAYVLVHSFDGSFHHPPPFKTNDGDEPIARLVMDAAGSMYGTANLGGLGDGVIFKVDPNGHERVLYNFTGPDAKFPGDDLAVDGAGNVYGTIGTLAFTVDASGFFTVLHTFNGADGTAPSSSLILDAAGNLYGVAGGGPSGHGFVYELSP